ncbi:MAG: hypothetical protein LBT05_14165 [Planctomycetaceae bacterium]|nr:hypothetical protein [Planctomycetaceae bacterium]
MGSIPSLVCQIAIGLMNENERTSFLHMLRPASKYDFRITDPCFIENSKGESFSMTRRCWIALSLATEAPISIQAIEDYLNRESEQNDGKHEILLDKRAVAYIVNRTNRILRKAKSSYRLSAKGGSFSIK